jgi:hypothetical protein
MRENDKRINLTKYTLSIYGNITIKAPAQLISANKNI